MGDFHFFSFGLQECSNIRHEETFSAVAVYLCLHTSLTFTKFTLQVRRTALRNVLDYGKDKKVKDYWLSNFVA